MGRLLDRLTVKCRVCHHEHIPRRLQARFLDGDRKRVNIWCCKECGHLWIDSALKADAQKSGQ
jgi:DNA-directed RNA polymerase subunit M/transcription elongation factor TFIIS